MKIIVGLGNPGKEYEHTRHNIGFMVLDAIEEELGPLVWKDMFQAKVATVMLGNEKVLLVKPMTYMNLSGEAVGPIARFYKVPPEDVYCIYDDMDLPVGKIRIRLDGSAGGHNGIKSMITHMEHAKFPRFRLGIGRPLPKWTVVDHVLAPFPQEDEEKVKKGVESMKKAVLGCVTLGMEKGMNRYNPSKGKR